MDVDTAEVWRKLHRRKLVQWALAYLAGAWAVLEVFDLVGNQFGWPSLLLRSFTIALGLGFLLALVLAWYHGERGAQRVSGTELLLLAVLLSLCSGLLWRYARTSAPVPEAAVESSRPATQEPAPAIAAVQQKSIAVLPFSNDSGGGNDQQYFSDGLSEDLITALSQFQGLKVISRSSAFRFRGDTRDSKAIGTTLGVAHVLEGSVRRAGDTVRISAQLVKAADGSTLWSQRYDRPYKDLFKLQDEIATAVAGALEARLRVGGSAVAQSDRPPSGNLQAYTAFLQAKFIDARGTERDQRAAIDYFNTAIRLDPGYAAAQAQKAITWVWIGGSYLSGQEQQRVYARARIAAAAAVAQDPDLALAHLAVGSVQFTSDFNLSEAETSVRRALQLAPDDAQVKFQLGMLQAALGRLQRAAELSQQALVTDPLHAGRLTWMAGYLMALGRLDEAEQASQRVIELQPGFGAHGLLAIIAILRGDAVAALHAARQVPSGWFRLYAMALALQIGTDRAAADAALATLVDTEADRSAFLIASVYALREQPDQAFAWLDRAWRQRDPGILHLHADPFLLRYRNDPRFAAICKKVGLPVSGDGVYVVPESTANQAATQSSGPSEDRLAETELDATSSSRH